MRPSALKVAPRTIYDALFSVQFVVGNALIGRPLDLATFYDRPLDDPEVLAMAALVSCPPDPDVDFPVHFSGEVRVHLTDGRVLERVVVDSHGTPQDPMTNAEVLEKLNSTAGRRIPAEQEQDLAELVLGIERLDDVAGIIDASLVSRHERH